jgi:hypothetical protein
MTEREVHDELQAIRARLGALAVSPPREDIAAQLDEIQAALQARAASLVPCPPSRGVAQPG